MKKNIFFIIPSLGGGGAERVFVNLVNGLDKSTFDVTLIYLSDERNVYEVSSGVNIINLNVKRVRNAPLKLVKLIRKEKPDLVFSTLGHLNSVLLLLKMFFPKNTKLIIRQTNIMSFNKSQSIIRRLIQRVINKIYKNADKIICQSEFMKKDFTEVTNVKENVVKIYNPVDIDSVLVKSKEYFDHDFNSAEKNLFFVGRLDEVKRIPLIIDAFKVYQIKNNHSNLYILGDGPEKKNIEDYIEKNELSNSVYLLGFQQNPYRWLSYADLFIMASKHEGMPNVLLETLALEIPVLILKHPGGTGEIMKELEIEDRFIEELIITEKSFNNYNKNIHLKLLKNFGLDNVIKKYEKTFIEVIERD